MHILTRESLLKKSNVSKAGVIAAFVIGGIITAMFSFSTISMVAFMGFSFEALIPLFMLVPALLIVFFIAYVFRKAGKKTADALQNSDLEILEDEVYDRYTESHGAGDDETTDYYVSGKLYGRQESYLAYKKVEKGSHIYIIRSKPTTELVRGFERTSVKIFGIYPCDEYQLGPDLMEYLKPYDAAAGEIAFEQAISEKKAAYNPFFKIRCRNCGSKFKYSKEFGVCPNCGCTYVPELSDIMENKDWYRD